MDDALSPRCRLTLFGSVALTGPDGVINLPSKKLAGLLAYLACTAPRPQPREKLAALLWGSHFDAQAKQNLRQALFRLRKALGPDALLGDGDAVSLNQAVVACDAVRFEALLDQGGRDALAEAVDLYRGRFGDDVSINEDGWTEWLHAERGRLEERALVAMLQLGEQELASGATERALKVGQRAIGVNNLREDAHQLVMRALAAAGRKAEALRHFQNLSELLKRELSTAPDAATQSLAAELRRSQASRAAADPGTVARPTPPPAAASPMPAAVRGQGTEPAVRARQPAPAGTATSPAAAGATGTERRQLTVMACALFAPSSLPDEFDPEEMSERIAPFHRLVSDVAARFGGFVAQHLGDGVVVYFGYPEAQEHDVEQALRAGVFLRDAVGALTTSAGVPLQARIGIATGLVVVGAQEGAGNERQHVAIGEAPNLAAQMQGLAAPGQVVIAANTRRLVGAMFDCQPVGGLDRDAAAAQAWQVRGEAVGVSRFEARRTASAVTSVPLVGREEEIALLRRRWEQVKEGEGRVVLLSGEAGIGKSRIVETLLADLRDEPHARLRYFCSPHHAHSPLHPFIAQLEQAADFAQGSGNEARLDRLQALLAPDSANTARDVALVAELMGVSGGARFPAMPVSPQQKREMTLNALLDQLDGIAARNPVLIVFEDAHWVDPTSLDLLDRTVARIAERPVLMLVTFRSEFQTGWVGQPHVTMLPLSRLGRRDSAGIISGITGNKALPEEVVQQILAHTDGVPLFIEELTGSLLESGVLRETEDAFVLDRPLPPLAIPSTLRASLVARLDRLGPVKDVAQIGATIGREFAHELIAAVASLAPDDLDAALVRLSEAGLISRRGTPPAATYAFRHALVQDAAHAALLRNRRRQLHASIGNVLVERFPAIAERQPEVVAHHFTEAGLAGEAVDYWRTAGQIATARSANREAASSFEQALRLLETLPESQETLEQAIDTRLELRDVLAQLGEFLTARQRMREAEALAKRLGDDQRRGRALSLITNIHSNLGELDEAYASGTGALDIALRREDLRLRIATTTYLEQVHYYRGEYARVVELAGGNLSALPAEWILEHFGLSAPASVFDRYWLSMSLAQLGRFNEAGAEAAEALRLAEPTQHAFTVGSAEFAAGTLHLLKGDWTEARRFVDRAVATFRAGGVVAQIPYPFALSAWVLARLGEAGEAVSRIQEGERLLAGHGTRGIVSLRGWSYHALGRAALLLGRQEEARRLADLAVATSAEHHGFMAHALHLRADIASGADEANFGACEADYRQAMFLAEPRGMRPLAAHCQLGLGTLFRRAGKRKQARQHMVAARDMYAELGMASWLDQAEGELAEPRPAR